MPPGIVAQLPSCLKNCPAVPPERFNSIIPFDVIGEFPTWKAVISVLKPTLVTVPGFPPGIADHTLSLLKNLPEVSVPSTADNSAVTTTSPSTAPVGVISMYVPFCVSTVSTMFVGTLGIEGKACKEPVPSI